MASEFIRPIQTSSNIENGGEAQSINESTLAVEGVGKAISSETFYMNSARLSLEKAQLGVGVIIPSEQPVKPYDPLAAVRAHMSADLKYAIPQDKKDAEGKPKLSDKEKATIQANNDRAASLDAVNSLQEFAGQTHNLLSEKVSVYELKIHDIENHYSNYNLTSGVKLEEQLASTRMTRGQKNVIRKAARELRHTRKLRNTAIERLRKTAQGK